MTADYKINIALSAQLEEAWALIEQLKRIESEAGSTTSKVMAARIVAEAALLNIGAQISDLAVKSVQQLPAAVMKSIQAFGKAEVAVQKSSAAIRENGGNVDILKARASGDEVGARELEREVRIAQLSAEIFETTRKEWMSRTELEALQTSAKNAAEERYNLEKSVSDEVERQNLAKDAQAKIEDILLENKIEQLKAEGKLSEATELERAGKIKKKLDGLKGFSAEDKDKVGNVLRQTDSYRDKQQRNAARNSSGGASNSAQDRRSSQDDSVAGKGLSSRRHIAPSRKANETWDQADARYSEAKQKKVEKRTARAAERDMLGTMDPTQRMKYESNLQRQRLKASRVGAKPEQSNTPRTLNGISRNSANFVSRVKVGGDIASASDTPAGSIASRSGPKKQERSAAASPAADGKLGAALSNRGAAEPKSDSGGKTVEVLDRISKNSDEALKLLRDIKNNTAATATKKDN